MNNKMIVRICSECRSIIPEGETKCMNCEKKYSSKGKSYRPVIIYGLAEENVKNKSLPKLKKNVSPAKEPEKIPEVKEDGLWMTSTSAVKKIQSGNTIRTQIWNGSLHPGDKVAIYDISLKKLFNVEVTNIFKDGNIYKIADMNCGSLDIVIDVPEGTFKEGTLRIISRPGKINEAIAKYNNHEIDLIAGFGLDKIYHSDADSNTGLKALEDMLSGFYKAVQIAVTYGTITYDEAVERMMRVKEMNHDLVELASKEKDGNFKTELSKTVALFRERWSIPYPEKKRKKLVNRVSKDIEMDSRLKDLVLRNASTAGSEAKGAPGNQENGNPGRRFTALIYATTEEEGGYKDQPIEIGKMYHIAIHNKSVIATVKSIKNNNGSEQLIRPGETGTIEIELDKPVAFEANDEFLMYKLRASWYRVSKGIVINKG